ncbi:MAG TPA: oligoribonuclease [Gammaproteobacteria bacterium]|jgi:oligoribonuclease|nr:oligoribonuclease [Gammaproteobacteria bacterium]
MALDPANLVWIDLEMTGLDPDSDRIIEIATVVTDADLNLLGQGPVLAIHQSDEVLAGMDDWNQRTHSRTGLIDRVHDSQITVQNAEAMTLGFLSEYVLERRAPLCGNTICQDRRFLYRYMPRLEAFLHYRNLDVSSIKELIVRWRPDIADTFVKTGGHRALDDILDSIEELKFYREHFFLTQPPQV